MLTNFPKSFQSSITLETGISDFHKMTIAILKTKYQKLPPKVIKYRCYKNFASDDFIATINHIFFNTDLGFNEKLNEIKKELDKKAPFKKRTLRGNDAPFMTSELRKAIMTRSRLRNKYLKDRTDENNYFYKKQRNYCLKLLRKAKKDYFENLNETKV